MVSTGALGMSSSSDIGDDCVCVGHLNLGVQGEWNRGSASRVGGMTRDVTLY